MDERQSFGYAIKQGLGVQFEAYYGTIGTLRWKI